MECDVKVIDVLNRIINDDSLNSIQSNTLYVSKNKIIGFFNMFDRVFDKFSINPDELNVNNIRNYLDYIDAFIGNEKQQIEEDRSFKLFKSLIIPNKDKALEMEKMILEKVSNDATNADKLIAFTEVAYKLYRDFKDEINKNDTEQEIAESEETMIEWVIKPDIVNKEAINKQERTIELEGNNNASIFGKRGVTVSLNLFYPQREGEYPSTYSGMKFNNVFKALTYIKAVYAYGINGVHDKKDNKSLFDEISNMTDDETVNFYNDISIKDDNYASKFKNNIPWILNELIGRSFSEPTSVNQKDLDDAIKFLKSNIPSDGNNTALYKTNTGNNESDNLINLYNAILSQNASEYVENYGDTKRSVSFNVTGVTLNDIIGNPQKLYVISDASTELINEIEKYESENNKSIENVTVLPKSIDISNDLDEEAPEYHNGINKDTDGIMVFSSSTYGYNTKTAKEAKEQGRLRTSETPEESPYNRMTFNQKGFSLEVLDKNGKPLEKETIIKNIMKLYYAARINKNKKFLIPYDEEGTEKTDTGYSGSELMELFAEAGGEKGIPKNVIFSLNWSYSSKIKSERYKTFVRETSIPKIKANARKISGDNSTDIEIDENSFKEEQGHATAYNTYLMNAFRKMSGAISSVDELNTEIMAVKEKRVAMAKVNDTFNLIKQIVYQNMLNEIKARKNTEKQNFTIGKISDVIPFLLMESNSSIPIVINDNGVVRNNILTEAAKVVSAYITNEGPKILKYMLNNNNAMYEVLKEKAAQLYQVGNINSQTRAALYMPSRESFSSVEEYNRILNQVVGQAKIILDAGGSVVTLSNKVMSKQNLVYQRTEDANKDVWNALYEAGYMPNYESTGVNTWTSKATLKDEDKEVFDERLSKLKEKLHELKHFTPSASIYEKDNVVTCNVILSNQMFDNLKTSMDNGVLTFSKSDPLYDRMFQLGKMLVDRETAGEQLRCNITIPATGSSYYSQITADDIKIEQDESISIVSDFKTVRNLEDYSDVDTEAFNKLRSDNIKIKDDNLKLKLGARKYNEFTNNIVKCLGEDLITFAKQDIEEFEKKINENQVEALRYWSTDKSSMSKEERQELKKKKVELDRETRKLSRIVEKLRNGDYVDYLNNWEYTDSNNKKWTGVLGFAKQSIDSKYGEFAFLNKDSNEYNEKVSDKEEGIEGLYLEKNPDVDPATYTKDKKEIHDRAVELVDSAIEMSNIILSNVNEFMSISFKRFGRKYGLKINTQVSIDKSTDVMMKIEKAEDSNFNSGEENNSEDANSEIEEDGVKFLDNYQAETLDIKKSLSQQIKELLETVFVRNDDKLTGYIQLDGMGEILYQNPDNVYNFLRENLTSVATYEEMEKWLADYVHSGHFEYGDLLSFLTSGDENLKTKFFVAMHTQSIFRVSGTLDKSGIDKMYDDNKDMRMKKLSDITSLCIGSRQRLVSKEADRFNFIGATSSESKDKAISVADELRSLSKKFEEQNEKYKNSKDNTNIFLSQNEDDVKLINEVIDTITYTLQGIGIPVSQKMIRDSITSSKEFYSLINVLTSRNKGFFPNISSFGRSSEITEYENRKYDYQNIFEIISTALYDTPQKGTVHAAGKDYASYMYPSFSSILFDKLNDNGLDEDGRRKNMKFIEEHFMQYPIFYKEDNLDNIRSFLEKEPDKYSDLIRDLNEDAINQSVKDSFVDQELAIEGKEGYIYPDKSGKNKYVNNYDDIPRYLKTNKRRDIVKEIIKNYLNNNNSLPDGCPVYQYDIWRNEWLKTIYKNFTNISHSSKKEKWERIQTSYLTTLNRKEYKNLTKSEHEQFLISSFLTTCNRTGFKFGSFYSPMVSDAEVCRTETFALMDGLSDVRDEATRKGLIPIALLAAKKLKKVVEAEIEMSDAIMQRYILRLESYNEYNKRVRNGENIRYWDCEGYSEPISLFDIEEARVFETNDNGNTLIDLSGLVFDDNGKLDFEKSRDVIFGTDNTKGRIKSLNAYKPSHYINVDTSGSIDLETQCYNELIKQFAEYLGSLSSNTTVPTKGSNIKIFDESEQEGSENYTNSFYEEESESNTEDETEEDKEDDEVDFLSSFVTDEDREQSRTMDEILSEKRKASSVFIKRNEMSQASSQYVKLSDFEIFKYVNKDALGLISRFFFEQAYANTQLQQLLNTSPAFYKAGNIVEVQKRGKEHNTPMIRLDLSRLKSPIQKSIILKDIDMDSTYDEIKEIINSSKNLSETEKKAIISAYFDDDSAMKITDGQAYRSPSGYKKIMEGLGRWDDIKETAYHKLMYTNEPITFNDIQALILNPVKGFNFSMEEVNLTPDYKILKPTQYKDSEAILLYAAFARRRKANQGSLVEQGSVLSGLVEFMEEHDIDCAVFESCVKEGGQGAVDISSAGSAKEAKMILESSCFYSNGQERDDVIHKTPWADYGIVSETPEHFFEEEAVFGTQIRRIMASDLIPDRIYNIIDPLTGKSIGSEKENGLTGRQIMDKYSDLIGQVLYDDFQELKELFNNNDKLEDFLLREVSGNPLYPSDIADYCKYNRKTNEFDKLGNPKNYAKTQQLLLSLFKNRITRQKIAGGSCVQVSVSYMNSGLDVKFTEVIDSEGELKKVPIEAECLLPAYMEPLYEKFLQDDGTIDFEAIKEYYKNDPVTLNALTSMVGYRIPTEGLSSTLKLKVKGFTNNYTGSSIILPKEIVTLSGSDFDIDKMYIHRFSFRENENGYPELITLDNYNKEDKKEKKEAYNNEIVKMMMGVMTLPENAMLMIKPQGFDNLKKSAAIANILKQPDNKYSVSELRAMSLKELKKMAKFDSGLSFLNPATQTYFQQQNMVGKNSLGIWAVARSGHCLFENSGIFLKPEYSFSFNSQNLSYPDPITVRRNGVDTYLAPEIGSFVGASADNAKDPVLAKLGITSYNIDVAVYLTRMGLDSTSMALMLQNQYFSINQFTPILNYFDKRFSATVAKSATQLDPKEYEAKLNEYHKSLILDRETVLGIQYNDELMANINNDSDAIDLSTNITVDYKNREDNIVKRTFTRAQVAYAIASLGRDIVAPAKDQLNQLTLALRSDSQNGAVKAGMAGTLSRIQQIEAAKLVFESPVSVFNFDEKFNKKEFFKTDFNASENVDYDKREKTNIGFVQDFTDFGVLAVRELTKGKLPHFGATFSNAFQIGKHMKNRFISEKNAKALESALFYYHFGNIPFFGNEVVEEDGVKSIIRREDKIKMYKEKMCAFYWQTIATHPELLDNKFISMLRPDPPLSEEDKALGKIQVLRMPGSNQLDDEAKTDLGIAFLELFKSDDVAIRKFGEHLVRYSFYRQGFQFLPDGYMNVIPNEVFESLEGYDNILRGLITTEKESALKNGNFIEQFLLNNISAIKSLNQVQEADLINNPKLLSTTESIIATFGYIPKYICTVSRDGYALKRFNTKTGNYVYARGYKEQSLAVDNKYFVEYTYFPTQEFIDMDVDVSALNNNKVAYSSYFEEQTDKYYEALSLIGTKGEYNGVSYDELGKQAASSILNNMQSALDTWLQQDISTNDSSNNPMNNIGQDSSNNTIQPEMENVVQCQIGK